MSLPGPPALQQLHHLDRSSSKFHDNLCSVFYGEEFQKCMQNLQGNDLVWLVEYLDKVRRHVALLCPPLKPSQAFDSLDPSGTAFWKCLHELRAVCGARGMLLTSYILSASLLDIEMDPFASGGYGDVYHRTLDGSNICIKHVRVYVKEGPKKATKVGYWPRSFPIHHC